MWQTRVSYADCAYITLVNTELGFRLFKLEISNFWFRVSDKRIAPLVGFCGALPCFDSIRRCAPLIRFCGAHLRMESKQGSAPQNPTSGAILVLETLNQKFEIPNLNNLNPNSVFSKVMYVSTIHVTYTCLPHKHHVTFGDI